VTVLLTRETRDVRYQAAEVRRERAMRRIVRRLSSETRERRAAETDGRAPGETAAPKRRRRAMKNGG
jgi:ERCC4-related helicase